MKNKFNLLLCFCLTTLFMACSNTSDPNKIIEQGKKSFMEYYKVNPDTCIQMDETHFLFINKVKKEMLDSIYFHVFVHQESKWNPIFSTGFEQYVLNPINDLGLQKIQGKDYFYLQYEIGGGNMGNNTIDFLAYRLDNSEEYSLSYEYNPPGLSVVSSINPSKNLVDGSKIYDFLYEKVRSSNQYKRDEFFQKAERKAKIPVVTDEAIKEKSSNYVGEYKGSRIIDGLKFQYFIGEDERYMIRENIHSTSLYVTITDNQGNFIVNDCFSPYDIHANYKDTPYIYTGLAEFRKDENGKFYLVIVIQMAESDSIYDEWRMHITRDGTVTWELLENENDEELW